MKAFGLVLTVLTVIGALAQDYENVAVDLYYETLCPASRKYYTTQLYPAWLELGEIMDVRLFPFGNAKYHAKADGGYLFTCQHGPDECTGNMIHVCAQNIFNDIKIEMPFVQCLLLADNPALAGETCANEVNQDYAPIDACVNSQEGEELLHNVGLKQKKLDPAAKYVPWIIVHGVHNDVEENACRSDTHLYVCSTYQGPPPDSCQNIDQFELLMKVILASEHQ